VRHWHPGTPWNEGNFARLFDAAAAKVRSWEKAHPAPL
jgi:DNA-binding transcriptional regulator YiaG